MEEDFSRIEGALERMAAISGGAQDSTTYQNLNYDFHYSLIAPCPNRQLLRMFENALKPIQWCWNLKPAWKRTPSSSVYDRHRKLFDIYRTRDREAFERLARSHIRDSAVQFKKKYALQKGIKTPSRDAAREE
jgi:DNA-binding GntR family transcriptional regulator